MSECIREMGEVGGQTELMSSECVCICKYLCGVWGSTELRGELSVQDSVEKQGSNNIRNENVLDEPLFNKSWMMKIHEMISHPFQFANSYWDDCRCIKIANQGGTKEKSSPSVNATDTSHLL